MCVCVGVVGYSRALAAAADASDAAVASVTCHLVHSLLSLTQLTQLNNCGQTVVYHNNHCTVAVQLKVPTSTQREQKHLHQNLIAKRALLKKHAKTTIHVVRWIVCVSAVCILGGLEWTGRRCSLVYYWVDDSHGRDDEM